MAETAEQSEEAEEYYDDNYCSRNSHSMKKYHYRDPIVITVAQGINSFVQLLLQKCFLVILSEIMILY